jgi:peroxiredoxin
MRIHRRWAHAASAVVFAAAVAWAALALPTSQAAEPARVQQSLPRFEGKTPDGKRVGTDLFAKRRGLIFAFGSEDPDADRAAALLDAIRVQAAHANIALLGIARDPGAVVTSNFMKRHGFEFPVILDSDGQISAKLRLPPGTASLTVVDARGYILGTLAGLASQPASQDAGMLASLRQVLELPEENVAATPELGVLPPAPEFEVAGLDGKSSAKLADYKGKVIVLVFFLPTCPHCHAMLKHLDALAKQLDNPDLAIVPVSVDDKKYVIEEMVGDLKISLVPFIDRTEKAQKAYGFGQTVPEVFVIDRQGIVRWNHLEAGERMADLVSLVTEDDDRRPRPGLCNHASTLTANLCLLCPCCRTARS